ncbi:MAG: arabinan endo-1,5-alpha-L-arabinosidase [Actinomycetes bacterium]
MTTTDTAPSFDGGAAGPSRPDPSTWGARNAHDPTAVRDDHGVYWLFSTDADADGPLRASGVQIRRSTDLVTWEYVGCALDGVPAPAFAHTGADGLWAPDVARVETADGVQWRMYYSASTFGSRTSAIGLATAPAPDGPWEDRGLVVATRHEVDHHNAIDAQLVIDGERHVMVYGSFFAGLHLVELDPVTGFALPSGKAIMPTPDGPASSPGTLIARRPRDVDTALEGPYVMARPGGGWALVVAYDSLLSTYHLRVAVARDLEGPYVDPAGHAMTDLDADPTTVGLTVLASHRLEGARGILAPGHASVLTEQGRQLLVHHTRFEETPRQHEVQVRRLVWTHEGWPLVSIQPWAGARENDNESTWPSRLAELEGEWEIVDFGGPTDVVTPSRRVRVGPAELDGLVAHGAGRFTRGGASPVDAVVFPGWDAVRGRAALVCAARGPAGSVVVGTRVG